MEHPVREFIRLGGRWASRPHSSHSAEVFVPGPWAGGSFTLKEMSGVSQPVCDEVTPGRWNRLETNGPVDGSRLEKAHPLHIAALEVSSTGGRSLAARVRLAEALEVPKGLLTIMFTVTTPDGRQVGGQEATVSSRTRDLTMEIPLTVPAKGSYRLKVSLSMDELVLDNARLEVNL